MKIKPMDRQEYDWVTGKAFLEVLVMDNGEILSRGTSLGFADKSHLNGYPFLWMKDEEES
jgi:hypothetical protein